jgi:organic radical activating enzyme
MNEVPIQEIFSSIQGEGPWIGERHIFVRFLGCNIHCRYCDTPAASCDPASAGWKFCTVQLLPGSRGSERIPNPLTAPDLIKFCSRLVIHGPSHPTISLTGGEPLLHRDFLLEWLPQVHGAYKIYLETNGIIASAMQSLYDLIDVVGMDFKLPSATGLRPFWDEHKKFLSAAQGKSLFIKTVVTRFTTLDDIKFSASIIAGFDKAIPLIIQPAGGSFAPEAKTLMQFQDSALGIIANARVIPQAHKILNVP